MAEPEFIAGDAGYGPLTTADAEHEAAFTAPPVPRKPWMCRLGMHRWRVMDGADFLNRPICVDCGKVPAETRKEDSDG